MSFTKLLVLAAALSLAGCGPRPDAERQRKDETRLPDGSRLVVHRQDGLVEGRTLLYAPAGHIRAIRYYLHDTLDGPQYLFYSNGRVQLREENYQGKLEGASYEFYASGRLASRRYLQQGVQRGPYRLYTDTSPPRLREAIDFVVVAGEEYANYLARYDSLGHLLSRTGRVVAQLARDTVAVGDTLVLRLRIEHPQHQETGVSTGGYDAQFVLRTPASEQRTRGLRHGATILVPTRTPGADTVRGYLEDFDTTSPGSREDEVMVKGRKLYFACPYFVKVAGSP